MADAEDEAMRALLAPLREWGIRLESADRGQTVVIRESVAEAGGDVDAVDAWIADNGGFIKHGAYVLPESTLAT